jgi:polysaccharide biosynthesis/export protein
MRTIRQLVLTMLLGLAGSGWAQDMRPVQSGEDSGTNTAVSSNVAAPDNQKMSVTMAAIAAEPSYVIGADDKLLISVWKEPDLTTTLPVRPDGMISVPLLDDVQAAGLTPMQLAALLTQRLKKYIAVPRVTVVVTQTNSHRVYVLGEVLHTGPISLLHKMTALQALAMAGFNEYANTKAIYILRTNNGEQMKIPFNYKRVIKGEAASPDIPLQPGDLIVVP